MNAMDEENAGFGTLDGAGFGVSSGVGMACEGTLEGDGLSEGQRVGRYVVVRDVNGQRHAVAAGAVAALRETDEGSLLLLPGGRLLHVPQSMHTVMRWLCN